MPNLINSLKAIKASHVTLVAACVLGATLYWGLMPNWKAWKSIERQNKAAQADLIKAKADMAEMQQRFTRSPVELASVSTTLARMIELLQASPLRHGVSISQVNPLGLGPSSSGTTPLEQLVQLDETTALNTLSLQVKGEYASLDGLYSFIDAIGPQSGMAVQSLDVVAKQFVLTVQAYLVQEDKPPQATTGQ